MPRRLPALCLALVLALLAPVIPAMGRDTSVGPVARDGRYLVAWRGDPPRSGVPGVASMSKVRHRRSVVVAEPGRSRHVRDQLARDPRVAAVVPDVRVATADWPTDGGPSDPGFGAQWGLTATDVPALWRETTGSRSTILAMIDTGISLEEADLRRVRLVGPWDANLRAVAAEDLTGHGTWTSAIAAAGANDGIGIPGIAPGVSLMPIRAVDETGLGRLSWILDGIDRAVGQGASVINISMAGTLSSTYAAVVDPVTTRAAEAGVLVVAAIGNGGHAGLSTVYPCAGADVLCVAGTNEADERFAFSNAGPIVDLAAPAERIPTVDGNGTWFLSSGTSLAAPHVAGIAALLRSARPEATAREVARALVESATDIEAPGRDDTTGAGLVNAPASLDRLDAILGARSETPAARAATTVPFEAQILHPRKAFELWERADTTVTWATSTLSAEAVLVEEAGRPVDGRCSSGVTWSRVATWPTHASRVRVSGTPNRCHRFRIEAVSPDGESSSALSATVLYHNELPSVLERRPAPGATGVARTRNVVAYLSEDVRGVSRSTVRLVNTATGRLVPGVVAYHSRSGAIVFNPTNLLRPNTVYRFKLRAGITDRLGGPLSPRSWTFRTGSR